MQEVKKKSHRMLTRRERERSRPERQFVTSDCPQVESERDAFEGQIGCDMRKGKHVEREK